MSFKSEFSEVYNYLSGLCKDPIITTSYTPKDGFVWQDKDVSIGVIIQYIGNDSVVKVPNGVVEIGSRNDYDDGASGCFELCEVEVIILPKSLKRIGDLAFDSCVKLKSINIPNSVTSIGDRAFADCHSLTSIDIPNSVESIGDYAFSGCSSLPSITIPNGVTSIGEAAFSCCYNLESISIPDSVKSIGARAFLDCESFESIIIPNSVTSIGDSAFWNSGLTSITCSADLDLSNASVPKNCERIRR